MNSSTVLGGTLRRRSYAVVAAAALSVGLAACGGSESSSGDSGSTSSVVVASYGGDYQEAQAKAYWEPFMKENPGIKVTQDSPSDNAKIKAMAQTGNATWDLVLVDDSFGLDADGKWLEPIDYSVVPKSDFLAGFAQKYRVGADVEATVLAYRADKLAGRRPSGFKDFFDTKRFPGKRAVWKYTAGGILEAALLADGVPADKLYPLDVDRALRKLDTIKKDIVWWTEGAQSQQLMSSGETTMGLVWTGRAVDAAETGADVKVQWNQWLTQNGWWVIPKGAKHKAAAMKLLAYQTSPVPQKALTKLLPYGPTNKHALGGVDPKYKDQLPTAHLDGRVRVDAEWWADNYDAVDKKLQAWFLG